MFIALLLSGALFAAAEPSLASASIFASLLSGSTDNVSASGTSYNSQTVPLLSPAINIDPKPSIGGGDITVAGGVALMSAEGPSGTAADIESRPSNSQISVYTVREGDTLSEIASMFSVTPNTIIWANDIQGGVIRPGQTLVILPITGIQHTVLKGETLSTLAKEYQSNAHDIAQYNNLADTAALSVGDVIIIPDGEAGAHMSVNPNSVSNTKQKAKAKTKSSISTKMAKIRALAKQGKRTSALHDAGGPDLGNYYIWPVDGGIITQGLHGFDAVDIGARTGTDILAAADGTVIVARGGGWNGGYGNYVVIQHSNGTQTLYAHASKLLVEAGDHVGQGDVIAKVGATGEATGSHLHFEVRGAKNPFGDVPPGSGE